MAVSLLKVAKFIPVETLEGLDMKYPDPEGELEGIVIE